MSTNVDPYPTTQHLPQVQDPRRTRGTRLLLAGSTIFAAAAVSPFTQGMALLDVVELPAGEGTSVGTSIWGEGAVDFLWSWSGWGWASGNGGMVRYLQVFAVAAMALVAIGALFRLRRGGPQRSIASVAVTAAVTLLLIRVWSDVYRTYTSPAVLEFNLEAFHFTPALVAASAGAVIAMVGAVIASIGSRPVGDRA